MQLYSLTSVFTSAQSSIQCRHLNDESQRIDDREWIDCFTERKIKKIAVQVSVAARDAAVGSLTQLGLADVDQHVGVGAVAHRQVVVVPAVVVLDGLLLGAPRHHIVVKLAPLRGVGGGGAERRRRREENGRITG